jgi:RND family efflux transporter MFP subunit
MQIMKDKFNSIVIVGCIVASGIILAGCESSHTEEEGKKEIVAAPAAYTEVFSLSKDKLSTSLQMPGELQAFQQVDLYAKVNSFVKKLYVDLGSEVKAGQLLAVMEAPEMEAQVSAAQSRLKSQEAVYIASKASYDRLYETSKTPGTISPNDLEQALAKMNSENAQLEAAKASFREVGDTRNYLEIRAPFSGMITGRNVNTGAYVGPSGKGSELPLFTLQEQKKLRLVISVPEAYSAYLQNQAAIHFRVKSLPNEKLTAKINRKSGAIDNRLRSQRIEMDVINNDKRLLPGMVAEVEVPMNIIDSSFVVPQSALVNSTERIFVIQIVNNKATWIDVKKGREIDGRVEIYGALTAGTHIVKTASEEIRDGSTVSNEKLIDK